MQQQPLLQWFSPPHVCALVASGSGRCWGATGAAGWGGKALGCSWEGVPGAAAP